MTMITAAASDITNLMTTLTARIEMLSRRRSGVINWGSPVPFFGDVSSSTVATVGINPSNREFVDASGDALQESDRRLHTLTSLGIPSWDQIGHDDIGRICGACCDYFSRNPYDGWFRALDMIIKGTGSSYYDVTEVACHLDLVPYATCRKWTHLSVRQRETLLELTGDTLGLLLKSSPVRLLILNGRAVVSYVQQLCGIQFAALHMKEWTLPRTGGAGVAGVSYRGMLSEIGGVSLARPVHVLGYNHNIQSSFGVTARVKAAIASWIGTQAAEALDEAAG